MQVLSLIAIAAVAATAAEVYFEESFSGDWQSRWVDGAPAGKDMGKWDVSAGKWFYNDEASKGLTPTEDMRHYSISSKMTKPSTSKAKDLVVQFSVKVENHQYAFCGGGYIKLLPAALDPKIFGGDDEYHIMFGPDLCGYDVSHIHAIFNHNGENLLKTDKISLEYSDKNEFSHLYTLHIKPDGTYEIFFDLKSKVKGQLVDDWAFPQKEIDDPTDSKPTDWVDDADMDDPAAEKPAGYDDIPAQSPDPDATKPEDWDDEDDGEWEAPMVDNPEFQGEWFAPRIANPAYKGEWAPKTIANKNYDASAQLAAYDSAYVGFELWIVNNGTIFDNILVTDDIEYAKAQGEKLWRPSHDGEKTIKEEWDKLNKPDEPEDDGEGSADDMDGLDDMGEDEDEKDEL